MEENDIETEINFSQEQFLDLLKRFYEKGNREGITVQKWLDDLKLDLLNSQTK